ncbi:uncharacterized protein with beta-barrel porin domain [Arthrobacter sp. V1I9]|nr:uncharacterized protein with beta-barrel porin domain [Arthrobacter sp. V1I9]
MKKSTKVFAAAAAGTLALTAGVTVAANAGPAPTAVPAAEIQPVPENVVQQNRVSVGASARAVQAALAKCQADKLPFVTVALVDRFGTVQALLRGDNAAEHTIEAARQKAYTAAAFGTPHQRAGQADQRNGPQHRRPPRHPLPCRRRAAEGERGVGGGHRRRRRSRWCA